MTPCLCKHYYFIYMLTGMLMHLCSSPVEHLYMGEYRFVKAEVEAQICRLTEIKES